MMWRHHASSYPMHNAYGAWWVLGFLMVILLAVAVALLLTMVIRPGRTASPTSIPSTQQEALEILRRRYAAGEIDDEELAHRFEALRNRTS